MSELTKRPAVLLAASWVLGYALAGQTAALWSGYLAVVLGICLAVVWSLRIPGRTWISCLLLIGIAASYYQWADRRNVSGLLEAGQAAAKSEAELSGAAVSVSGIIATPVEVDGDRASFAVRVKRLRWDEQAPNAAGSSGDEGGTPPGDAPPAPAAAAADGILLDERMQVSLRLLTPEQQQQARAWQRGDAIELHGATLQEPSAARNFGGFDYRRYLRMQHIHWLITVKGTERVRIAAPDRLRLASLLRWNDGLREAAGRVLDRIYPGTQAGFMKSLLIGLRDDLDPQGFQQFSQLGLTHILAISGLHVAVFVGGCMLVMRRLGRTKEASLLVSLSLVPLYIVFTGASPSVIRAGLMAMIALYASYRKLLKDGLNLACIVGGLMLLWNPYYLYDVSFQLSFLVTIGLIVFVPRVSRLLPIASPTINSAVSVAIVSQVISFPLSIYYFNQFSLLSWLANLIIVPALSFLGVPLGSASLILGALYEPAGRWAAWPAIWLNRLTFWTVDQMSGWSAFHLIWPSPSIAWILCYYALVGWICAGLERLHHSRERKPSAAAEDSGIPAPAASSGGLGAHPAERVPSNGSVPVVSGQAGDLPLVSGLRDSRGAAADSRASGGTYAPRPLLAAGVPTAPLGPSSPPRAPWTVPLGEPAKPAPVKSAGEFAGAPTERGTAHAAAEHAYRAPDDAGDYREVPSAFAEKHASADLPLEYPLAAPGGGTRPFRPLPLILAFACFAGLLVYGYQPDRWEREGRIHFIDVGQGDAILIHTPQDKHILVDGGGTLTFRKPGEEWKERRDPYEVGRKLLVPLLKKRGVHQIDYLILTHEDADHYGGLQAVVEQIPVRQFIFNGTYKPGTATRKLFETILDKRIPMQVAGGGKKLRIDDATEIEFLLPFAEDRQQLTVAEKQNDDSVVFLLRMYGARFLFTGDMEKDAEAALLTRLQEARPAERGDAASPSKTFADTAVDVLKVAHHGSKTSTTGAWLDYWQPRMAVISVGENNLYGHPNDDVLQRLEEHHTEIFRTDRNGEVLFRVTAEGLRKETKLITAIDGTCVGCKQN